MDKAAIFAEVTRRNALRREYGLPLLDIPAEYLHSVALAQQRDFQAIYQQHAKHHAGDRAAIGEQVTAEHSARHGVDHAQSMAGRWAIGKLTRQRFVAYLAHRYAVAEPGPAIGRNPVVYGGGRGD